MNEMDQNKKLAAINALAPCGLDCSRCVDFKGGEVSILSKELLAKLEGYEHIAELAKAFSPELNYYGAFIDILKHFANSNCPGCRHTSEGGCQVRRCHKDHHVDFCAQCENYPCEPKMLNTHLYETWRENNDAIKAQGIETFYTTQKSKPRY